MTQSTDKKDITEYHSVPLTNTPFVEVTKEFDAPVEDVWQAWSDPEMIKQWWGPETYTCPLAEIDFRVEGKYLLAMESPTEVVMYNTGVYNEIFTNELIVCTDSFSDEEGNPITPVEAGMSEDWEGSDSSLFSVKFERLGDNRTKIRLVHEGIPALMHDDCVGGWSSSLDKMKKLVEKH